MTTGYCLNPASQIQSSGYEGHFDNGALNCKLFPYLFLMQYPDVRQGNFIKWILMMALGNSTLGACGVKSKIGCGVPTDFAVLLWPRNISILTPPFLPQLCLTQGWLEHFLGLSVLARAIFSFGCLHGVWKSLFWTWSKYFFKQLTIHLSFCEETQTGDS